ncbi:MAG TPA: aminotransferase class IV [Planctomycetota bacterium]|nr:aminotransferase class IV [Planctomycetota bacterium]
MTVWVDGEFLPDGAAPEPGASTAPFETMGAHAGSLPLWSEHIARLSAAASRCGLLFRPSASLHQAACELLAKNGDTEGILRLALLPEAPLSRAQRAQDSVRVVLTTRPRQHIPFVRLLPTVAPRPAEAPAADLKAFPRTFYDAVLFQAQAGGADDGIVVGADGAVLETATGNLWLRLEDGWVTPALDGRVLPGIARARLLAGARRSGLRVVERVCDLGDLHRARALAHSNAVYGPRAACLLETPTPAVAIVDTQLGSLWRSMASG